MGEPPAAEGIARLDAKGGIAIPGLVNTHHHFYQTMARAYTPGNNQPLLPWLAAMNKLWRPFNDEDLYLCSKLALAEMMLTGCTTAADHHYITPEGGGDFFAAQFRAAAELKVRFHGGRGSMDTTSPSSSLSISFPAAAKMPSMPSSFAALAKSTASSAAVKSGSRAGMFRDLDLEKLVAAHHA